MQWQSWLRLCATSWKVADLIQFGGWNVSNFGSFFCKSWSLLGMLLSYIAEKGVSFGIQIDCG